MMIFIWIHFGIQEDLEKELLSRASRGSSVSQHIMVS